MRWNHRGSILALAMLLANTCDAPAQQAPEIGYIYPPGGRAGSTVTVRLGGYDWTPDMQFFVHTPGVKLQVLGPPGAMLLTEPPYWFGPKGRIPASPIPREILARLTIPENMPAGPIHWQAANANGATAISQFIVSQGREISEDEQPRTTTDPQVLSDLPLTVSGRLGKIAEVDRYQISPANSGPITCELMAHRIGSPINGMLEVHDATGRLIADAADTEGVDTALTFTARDNEKYTLSVYDFNFRGHRSYVYRLAITPGPRIVAAIPAAGRRGETRQITFIGHGVASGGAEIESLVQEVMFPNEPSIAEFYYRLRTPHGISPPFRLLISDMEETVEPTSDDPHNLAVPGAVTGVLDRRGGQDHYLCAGAKGDVWEISLQSQRLGSPLDVTLTVFGPDGKELAKNDDLPGTTDSGLQFDVPADANYKIRVSDISGSSGRIDAIYRLVVRPTGSDFAITVSDRLNVPLGGKAELAVKAVRKGGFRQPISVKIIGLPQGISVPENLVLPADKNELKIAFQSAKDAPAIAAVARVIGTATVGETTLTRTGGMVLVASTMKPRAKVTPVDKDGGRTVHRGTTYPAPVLVQRFEDFQGEIVLQMAARQSYRRQGINGSDVIVPPGETQTVYPVFLPEWLETSRTSRMILNAVTKVPDPHGNVRYLVNRMDGRITMSVEGALLKITGPGEEIIVRPGQPFDIPITISRSAKLRQPVQVRLRTEDHWAGLLSAQPLGVGPEQHQAVMRIAPVADESLQGEHRLTVRATALVDGKYPVISETKVLVVFVRSQ